MLSAVMPKTQRAVVGALLADQGQHRVDRDVGRQREERDAYGLDGDRFPPLRVLAGELPGDGHGREYLDNRVEPEADERRGRGEDTRQDCDDRLDYVVRDREADDEADAPVQRRATCGGQGLAHAPAAVPQQSGTEHTGSMHGAASSTASVTSIRDVSAATRCGSAIS